MGGVALGEDFPDDGGEAEHVRGARVLLVAEHFGRTPRHQILANLQHTVTLWPS